MKPINIIVCMLLAVVATAQVKLTQIERCPTKWEIPVAKRVIPGLPDYAQTYMSLAALVDSVGLATGTTIDSMKMITGDTLALYTSDGPFKVKIVLSGGLTGSGTATRVAFWSASSTLSSNANLFWDNSNSRLGIGTSSPDCSLRLTNGTGIGIGGYVAGDGLTINASSYTSGTSGSGLRIYNWNAINNGQSAFTFSGTPTASSFVNGMDFTMNFSGALQNIFKNSIGTSSLRIESGSDAYINFNSSTDWSAGIDNSDSDKFKIMSLNGLASSGDALVGTSAGLWGLNVHSPARTLDINGELRIRDLVTDNPTKLVGTDNDGDLSGVTLGTGLSWSGTTLNAAGGPDSTIVVDGYGINVVESPANTWTVSADTSELATPYDLTDKVGGSGTTNVLPKWSASKTLTDSQVQDNGTNVGIGAAGSYKLDVEAGSVSPAAVGTPITRIKGTASSVGPLGLHIHNSSTPALFNGSMLALTTGTGAFGSTSSNGWRITQYGTSGSDSELSLSHNPTSSTIWTSWLYLQGSNGAIQLPNLSASTGEQAIVLSSDNGTLTKLSGVSANTIPLYNGTSWGLTSLPSGGITSLGGETGSTQTFAYGKAGATPSWSSGSNVHTFRLPTASAGQVLKYISNDWRAGTDDTGAWTLRTNGTPGSQVIACDGSAVVDINGGKNIEVTRSSAAVTVNSNNAYAQLEHSSGISVTWTNSWQTLNFNTQFSNDISANTTTDRITVPATGVYEISYHANAYTGATTANSQLGFRIYNVSTSITLDQTITHATASQYISAGSTRLVNLTSGHLLEMQYSDPQMSGSSAGMVNNPYFSLKRIN